MFTAHNQRQSLVLVLFILIVLLTSTSYADPRVGPVTPINSIIGGNADDQIGNGGVYELPNGNIVISSPNWNGNRGAVTCLTPEEYRAGGIIVSAANSLVGSTAGDGIGGVTVLKNGNYVVSSPGWDNGAATNAGAVTWVNGSTCIPYGETSRGAIVSAANSLVGSSPDDMYIHSDIVELANGNYVVVLPYWNNNTIQYAGAVTWVDGSSGTAGPVSPANSLVGSMSHDYVGMGGIGPLPNGNYVVGSPYWNDDVVEGVGAVTLANGSSGTVGLISEANSLIGSSPNDYIGGGGLWLLSNGNYVVSSPNWDNGAAYDAGAVTLVNGVTGLVGIVTNANSLVGTSEDDQISANYDGEEPSRGILPLTNGNFVVISPSWDHDGTTDAGAVTWVNGSTGLIDVVSSTNSLVGSTTEDRVGSGHVIALTNGNYVVGSNLWDNDLFQNVGAVTWGNGNGGTVGTISAANSLIGSNVDEGLANTDGIVFSYLVALTNGNYVVSSPYWNNGSEEGAVVWGNGNGGTVGTISPENALVGATGSNFVAEIFPLTNGNYVVVSPWWNNGAATWVGAVTWGNGNGGTVGIVSAVNSLVGTRSNDTVGIGGIVTLTNGNYVILTSTWANGTATRAGAVTWGDGNTGIVGPVSSANSLVGSTTDDRIGEYGFGGVIALPNGNYVVGSREWDNGTWVNAGAVTWGNGNGGTVGTLNATNSLIGGKHGDNLGPGISVLANGNYVVSAPFWDNGPITNAGSVAWGSGIGGTAGIINEANALVGSSPEEKIGWGGIYPLSDSSFVVVSSYWDNGGVNDVGAVTWSDGSMTSSDNLAPVLANIGNRTTYLGKTLSFDVDADDPNLPAQTLTFSLESGAPAGTAIDPVSGQFSWTLDETVTVGDYPITVTVTDDGDPALSDSETFSVTVEAANLVSNYGFENAGNNQKLAAGWKAIQLTKNDRRMCDTDTKSYAREGACAYRFSISKNTTLKRTIQKSASKTGVVKDDTLELRGWVSATNLTAGARLSLTVTYNNDTKKVVNISLTAGTYEYQRFSKQVTLTRAVKSLKVKIEARKAKGTFFVDDVAVVEVAPESLAVSVPAALDLRGVD